MKKIIFTGGTGRFGRILKETKSKDKIYFPTKKQLNINNLKSIENYIKKTKAKYFIHAAGFSRPMRQHDTNLHKSIMLNIVGTSNVVVACKKYSLKLIYFSTNYVYPGKKGNYKEDDGVNPINNYALSKLGGESAVRMYKNSLILRICMTEKPFIHKYAFSDVFLNFMFHDELVRNLNKILKFKGILNVGGRSQTVYNFAKKNNPKIKKISAKSLFGKNYPLKQSMNISKYKKIIK